MSIERLYSERARTFGASADAEERRSLTLSRTRLAVFAVGAVSLAVALSSGGALRSSLLAAAVLGAVAFVLLVGAHNRVDDRLQRLSTLTTINRQQEARVRRDWAALPTVDVAAAPESHPYAHDLDIIGRASLFTLCGAAGTPEGVRTLRDWLLAPAPPADVPRRQEAVIELTPLVDFRQELQARAVLAAGGRDARHAADLGRFLDWAEGPPWLISRWWLVWLTRLLGMTATGLALAHAAGVTVDPLWLLPALLDVVLWFALVRRIEHTFNRAFARDSAPGQDARMFEVVCGQRFGSPLMQSLRARIADADRAMHRLQRLMELADIRLTTLVHFPLNALTLWDFHVLGALERWQVRWGRHARDWYTAVGEIEPLSAFAGLRHDNPGWTLPRFAPEAVFDARELGHPLIPEGRRVSNDVKVGPPGTFLFVTGSNMSGKSTLLRAVGVNAVLAHAGAPVCAASLQLPRVSVYTSMRVQDSLEEGVSYFMAALKRLKAILADARELTSGARAGSGSQPGVLLYLLDEILQGTNTAERQIAVRTILGQLLASGAIGAVTSHDLNLADSDEMRQGAIAVHFEEHFERGTMVFDYTLRRGLATSRNALKLMQMIGIEPPPSSEGGR